MEPHAQEQAPMGTSTGVAQAEDTVDLRTTYRIRLITVELDASLAMVNAGPKPHRRGLLRAPLCLPMIRAALSSTKNAPTVNAARDPTSVELVLTFAVPPIGASPVMVPVLRATRRVIRLSAAIIIGLERSFFNLLNPSSAYI